MLQQTDGVFSSTYELITYPTLVPFSRSADGTVYLTFDDGPGWHTDRETNRVLDILASKDVKATFFVLGMGVDRFPATVSRMVSEGHTVGSHSYDHLALTELQDDEIRRQMRQTEDAILRAVDGPLSPIRYFRPPYGIRDARTDRIVHEMEYEIVMWDVDSMDWQFHYLQVLGKTHSDLAESMINQIARGSVQSPVVLLHSIHSLTVRALPIVLDRLKENGHHFAAIPCNALV
jgi:peptidoglycan/xylan/chitin deacetylase (PgdA/CDA1 family)